MATCMDGRRARAWPGNDLTPRPTAHARCDGLAPRPAASRAVTPSTVRRARGTRMPAEPLTSRETDAMPDRGQPTSGLRSHGMRDLGPEEMARFRAVERAFLETTAA